MEHNTFEYWDEYYRNMWLPQKDPYDNWLSKYRKYFHEGMQVLDLGCGAGTNISAILSFKVNVVAADFSTEALKLVKRNFKNADVQTIHFDMREKFPMKSDCFDVIIADLSLHYFDNAMMMHIVQELQRVIKREGVLFGRFHSTKELSKVHFDENRKVVLHFVQGYYRRYFTMEELLALFKNWEIILLEEKEVSRYSQIKKCLELAVRRNI